ncbi:MAG TPA: hypothetical protein VHE61_01615 [Opitutaceae bacterium]|nr:hypothetical protein [Opitutaceae bacterium]
MPKTRKDLLLAIADRIGGERGRRMREAVQHSGCLDLMDRELSDEEFAAQLENAERDLPKLLGMLENMGPEQPGSWGFPN